MFPLNKGEFVNNPDIKIRLGYRTLISKRVLKHVIERRKENGSTSRDIFRMLVRTRLTLKSPDFMVPNKNKVHISSFVAGKFFKSEDRGLVVVFCMKEKMRHIITLFYRDKNRFKKLQR